MNLLHILANLGHKQAPLNQGQAQQGLMNGGLSGEVPGLQSMGGNAPLNLGQVQHAALNGAFTPGSQVPGLQVNRSPYGNSIPMGRVRGVEGFIPQDTGGNGYENPLQRGGYNPQTSQAGGFQQGGHPQYGQYGQAADPYGWMSKY